MTTPEEYRELGERLSSVLHLQVPPVAISFAKDEQHGVAYFDQPMSELTEDGRAGRVPAGCVFWVHGATKSFATAAADHGNCSVGSFTHGFVSLGDVAANSDVATLLESGWVNEEAVMKIPQVREKPAAVLYGPLHAAEFVPDVVLLRVNGRQLMVLSDSIPNLRIEGKPQCHIIAIAKNEGAPAASVGCALSRARTGMQPDEMTCALPAAGLASIVEAVEQTAEIDTAVAKYAAADARRFA